MEYTFEIDFGNGYEIVAGPRNKRNIKLQIVWDSPTPSAFLSSNNFEWEGETAEKIYNYRQAGLTGGYGIYEGLPLRIKPCVGNPNVQAFELVLDLINSEARFSCDEVLCPAAESGRIDWLNDIAAAYYFWYLASTEMFGKPGHISQLDYRKTPYQISEIPNYSNLNNLAIATFAVIWQIYEVADTVKGVTERLTAHMAQAATGLGLDEVIQLIPGFILLVAMLAYITFLIKEFFDLLRQLIDNIIQIEAKYKLCMEERVLFERMCQFLGLQFSSSIYAEGSQFRHATWMPRKIVMPSTNNVTASILDSFDRPMSEHEGFDRSYGHFDGSFKEFIEVMEMKYNAKHVIKNGVFYFEEKHGYNLSTQYNLPNTGDVGYTFNYPDPHGTNASELPPSYHLAFQIDDSELNTVHFYRGTTYEVQVQPAIIKNQKNLLHGKGVIVQLPCALAKRKEFMTALENKLIALVGDLNEFVETARKIKNIIMTVYNTLKILKTIASVALPGVGTFASAVVKMTLTNAIFDAVLDLIDPPDIAIENRVGWMLLSNDSFSIPKTFIGVETRVNGETLWYVAAENTEVMSAKNLMTVFHGNNLASRGAQRITYDDKEVPFCCEDFIKVMQGNKAKGSDGKIIELKSMVWNLYDEKAEDVRFDKAELFTKNFKEMIIENGTKQ